MTLTIRDIRARPVMVPFKRPPASASGALPHAALVLVDLETEEGITGRSYLFGFGRWSLEPLVGCLLHMRDLLKGDRVAPVDMEAKLRAVKKRVGDKVTVMCDYNQRLTVNEAIRRGRMLDGEGLYWIEEPVRHDDYAGCARIAAALETPIQTGENLVDTFELLHALEAKAMDYVMPDLQR